MKIEEKTLEYLEKALQYAHDEEERPDKTKYDVLWLCFCENNSENRMKHSQQCLYDDLLKFIEQQNISEWLNNDERFTDVLDIIREHC